MRNRKLASVVGATSAFALTMGVGATAAHADAGYGPGKNDAVGVGSDTVQYALDFLADGDYVGDTGYNFTAPSYRLVNFDATPDANARLAYGPDGASGSPLPIAAAPAGLAAGTPAADAAGFGTGTQQPAGTYFWEVTALVLGNSESVASNEVSTAVAASQDVPLSWTAVTGAVQYKVYRGTSTGTEKLVTTVTTNSYTDKGNATSGATPPTGPTTGCAPGTGGAVGTGNATGDLGGNLPCILNPTIVVRAGRPPVLRPNGSGAGATAMVNDSQHLLDFFRASSKQGSKFSPASLIDSVQLGTDPLRMLKLATGSNVPAVGLSQAELNSIYTCTITTWSGLPGNSGGSTDTIIPIVPQVGSGTRSSFLDTIAKGGINVSTPGNCVKTAEENDPTAIEAQSNPKDAIEPMSGGRLNLFQGKDGSGTSISASGYFKDPSCGLESTSAGYNGTACTFPAAAINPNVVLVPNTGTAGDGATPFGFDRPLYIYFRDADVGTSSGTWEPGSATNKIRTLFYNPCFPAPCAGFGPGGAPFIDTTAGQALISAAGISPTYVPALAGP